MKATQLASHKHKTHDPIYIGTQSHTPELEESSFKFKFLNTVFYTQKFAM